MDRKSVKGEQELANRGYNNEDKTGDGGLPGLQMKTEGKTEKQRGEVEAG